MVQNQNRHVDIEWLLYHIGSQIDELVWMAVKMESDQAIFEELSAVEHNIESIKALLHPQPGNSKETQCCTAIGL